MYALAAVPAASNHVYAFPAVNSVCGPASNADPAMSDSVTRTPSRYTWNPRFDTSCPVRHRSSTPPPASTLAENAWNRTAVGIESPTTHWKLG